MRCARVSPGDLVIEHEDDIWTVEGPWLDRLVAGVNFSDYESRMYFDRVLRDGGVYEQLEALGIQDGNTVSFCGMEFDYKR